MGGAAAILIRGVLGRGGLTVNNIVVVVLVIIVVASSRGCGCWGQRCHDEEKRALLELKESSTATFFRVDDQEDCCRWSGIDCSNHTGRVVGISLRLRRVTEDDDTTWYPNFTSLVQFRELERLSISSISVWNRRIGSTSLNDLCDLKYLKKLSLGTWNSLVGPIPQCFCNMRSLTRLHLSGGNNLNNRVGIPSCLGNLHNLQSLRLWGIKNTNSTFLEGLCNLRQLKQLGLGLTSLEGLMPQCLCSMHSLTHFKLLGNHLNGSIPLCLGNLHNLLELKLVDNRFEGSIPPSIFPNLTKLQSVAIKGDHLEGTLSFSVFANLSDLNLVSISSNHGLEIEFENPRSWIPSFQLRVLNISGCMVNNGNGGRFPTSFISTQTRLNSLRLADDQITGTIPLGMLCNSSLSPLDLSEKLLHGTFPLACHNASHPISQIDLSHNLLHGSLPKDVGHLFPNLQYLYMAGNKLKGTIPPSLGQAPLYALDLSDNNFSGQLPHTLTRNQTILTYLNVSYNQLDGEMLPKDSFMPQLKFLFLHHNHFTGSIPPKISNSSLLRALDVGYNGLTCSLSHCLPSFPTMVALSLTKNRFGGHLPNHLCQMQHLHLLDLSRNNLIGKIPPCLGNNSFWKSSNQTGAYDMEEWTFDRNDVMQFTSKKLFLPYQGATLRWMTALDFSSNRLDGAIPREIGELKGLLSLNLSNNLLQGSLPPSIGNMKSLESLDLSHNNLSGTIPHELVQLNSLSVFSVAYNKLFGEIPYSTQFSTFPNNSYEGNPELCGAPLERNCSSTMDMSHMLLTDQKQVEEGPSLLDNPTLFYAWLVLSFAVGFWGFIATIVFNRRWKIKYFRAVDKVFAGFQRRF